MSQVIFQVTLGHAKEKDNESDSGQFNLLSFRVR